MFSFIRIARVAVNGHPGAASGAVRPAPAVTDVLPSVGSAAGGATIKIVGTGSCRG